MAVGDKYYLGGRESYKNYFSYNGGLNVGTNGISFGFEVNMFKFISNDSETDDLIITFNDVPKTQTGLNGAITLKPREVINDLNIKATKINLSRNSGSGNVRFLGV
ncbi:hypothetical protein [Rummeliibacillus sp. TYF-LIM-RU47]|uniref:hypothetical protein n=1 Tax=Rummeliibacillus sp. TYF-LIM-RU47 TaxID=2608406 RepID=UPI0012388B42|nr:hypothetical protein [Rummeliibacillus sp. TYF-LIM-RU47]